MIPLDLNASEMRRYRAALRADRRIRIRVDVLNRNEKVISSLSTPRTRILEGQVNADFDADVSRSLTLTALDPGRKLHFDGNSPADGALFADRFVRVRYGVWVEALDRWVDVPVFTGPVTRFDRDGEQVAIEAQGKESLALAPAVMWEKLTIPKGTRKTVAIRRIMEAKGEARFSGFSPTARLPHAVSLARMDEGWKIAQRIARGMDRQLFYDGAGILRLRRIPRAAAWTFRTGDDGDVLTAPQVAYDMTEVRNAIIVVGRTPEGAKQSIKATAIADRGHPLSPYSLARNGEPRFLAERIEDSSIRSKAEAQRVADSRLARHLRAEVQVAFESLPIPHLEPGDIVAVETDDFAADFPLRSFSLPLTTDGTASVGFMKRARVRKKRIR